VFEFSGFVDGVNGLEGLLDWSCRIWRVKEVGLDLIERLFSEKLKI
jgi:hypothetical protein